MDILLSGKKLLKEEAGLIRFVVLEMWTVDCRGAQWEQGGRWGCLARAGEG